nr:hypothetical protein CFP56_24348 [Quercus suber]
MPSPEEYARRHQNGLLGTIGPTTAAYQYLTVLIAKSEEDAPIPVPESERRDAPFAMDNVPFHSQMIKRRPQGIRIPELHALGREAAQYAVSARLELLELVNECRHAVRDGRQPLSVQNAISDEGMAEELRAVRAVDLKWQWAYANQEISLMLARIEELVEARWAFEKRIRVLAREKEAREREGSGARTPRPSDNSTEGIDLTEYTRILNTVRNRDRQQ